MRNGRPSAPSANRTGTPAFAPSRVAIETATGAVVQERHDPRASFTGHVMNTPWDPLHLAYFNGYAMWTYLTTPFFMAMPDFK
jgi:hypothetical protein